MDTPDFLSGLLDRAQGRAPVLERRRASRFEPTRFEPTRFTPGGIEPTGPRSGTGLEEADVFVDVENSGATLSSPVYRPATIGPITGITPEATRAAPAATRTLTPLLEPVNPEPRVSTPNVSKVIAREEAAAPSNPPRAAAKSETPESETGIRSVRETIVEREVERRAIEIRVAQPRMREAETPGVAARNEAIAPLRRENEGRSMPPGVEARQQRVEAPRPVSPASPRTGQAEAASRTRQAPGEQEAAAMPTIHVTIGRIEVRATAAAPGGANATRRSGPKLNLDDYLRSRGGGRG